MSNSLTTTRPEDQARAKSRLLQQAAQRITESGAELDLSAGLQDILVHIVQTAKLSQRDPDVSAKATAIAIVTLNIGLEYATRGDVEKAVATLTRNPIQKIYAIGEKIEREMRERVVAIHEQSIISVANRTYGITDHETEEQLIRWSKKGLSDHPFLPVGTLEELDAVSQVLDRVEREIKYARLINWSEVLASSGVSQFAAELYRRANRTTPSAIGGVWRPFILTLLVNAMTLGWYKRVTVRREVTGAEVETYVYTDHQTVIDFCELLCWSTQEEQNKRATNATFRVTKLACQEPKPIFQKKLTTEAVMGLLEFAGSYLAAFQMQTREFYFQLQSPDAPTTQEVERFWQNQLLIYDTTPVAERLTWANAEVKDPWSILEKAKTLREAAFVLKSLQTWSQEKQNWFYDQFKLDPLLDREGDVVEQAKALEHLWKSLSTVLPAGMTLPLPIDWRRRQKLIEQLLWNSGTASFTSHHWIRDAATQVEWRLSDIEQVYEGKLDQIFDIMMHQLGPKLTESEWRKLVKEVGHSHGARMRPVWEQMSERRQHESLLNFDARNLSSVFDNYEWLKIQTFFATAIERAEADSRYRREFLRWFDGFLLQDDHRRLKLNAMVYERLGR